MNNEKLFDIVWGVLLFIFGCLIGFVLCKVVSNPMQLISLSGEIEAPVNCTNFTSIEDTVKCSVTNVKTFYNYTSTPDTEYKDEEALRIYGGDCLDWSRYYRDVFYDYNRQGGNFTPYIFTIHYNSTANHAFSVISQDNGNYCLIDQTTYYCKELR